MHHPTDGSTELMDETVISSDTMICLTSTLNLVQNRQGRRGIITMAVTGGGEGGGGGGRAMVIIVCGGDSGLKSCDTSF